LAAAGIGFLGNGAAYIAMSGRGRYRAFATSTNEGGRVYYSTDYGFTFADASEVNIAGGNNDPFKVYAVEPYINVIATGGTNTAGLKLIPSGGRDAYIGHYGAAGIYGDRRLILVAGNSTAAYISGNGNIESNGGFFINNDRYVGLYNSFTQMYLTSKDAGYYDISSNSSSVSSLRFFTGGNLISEPSKNALAVKLPLESNVIRVPVADELYHL